MHYKSINNRKPILHPILSNDTQVKVFIKYGYGYL